MRRIMTCLLLLLMTSTVTAQTDDPCFDKGGRINEETGMCEISEQYEIGISYPVEVIGYDFIELAIDDFIDQTRTNFLNEAAEFGRFPDPPWSLYGDYFLTQPKPDLMSVGFMIYQYNGGANGFSYPVTFLFDLETEAQIDVLDLFQPGVDGLAAVRPLAEAQLADFLGDADMIFADGLEPTPENYANFQLTEDELIFIFGEYQVAPGVAGSPSIAIPLSELTDILEPRFLP